MVIQCFDTVVTDSAMITSRWSPDVASLAILDGHIHCSSIGCSKLDHDPVVLRRSDGQWVFVRSYWRKWMEISWEDLLSSVIQISIGEIMLTPGSTRDA